MSEERWFPLQVEYERGDYSKPPAKVQYTRIPWSVAEKAYATYVARYGNSQSLERIAERCGFHNNEMDLFHPTWREEADENVKLRKELLDTKAELGECWSALERMKEREAHFSKLLHITDGGQYRNDWDGRVANLLAAEKERDELEAKLNAITPNPQTPEKL